MRSVRPQRSQGMGNSTVNLRPTIRSAPGLHGGHERVPGERERAGGNAVAVLREEARVTRAVQLAVAAVLADDDLAAEMRQVASAALRPYLEEGVVETVTTSYGPFTWTVSYNKEVDEEL